MQLIKNIKKNMKAETRTVAIINKSKILVIENGQKLVPIKPICEALGIDVDSQRKKINDDDILSSVAVLSTATGSDGKGYSMFCIPFKYVFGWLFTINPANVKEEAREAITEYKRKCYDVLYQSFSDAQEFLEEKQSLIELKLDELEQITSNFNSAKTKMSEKKKELNMVRSLKIEDWIAANRQLDIFENPE
jgi:hypothetical protein